MREIELFEPLKGRLNKKICVGVVSHRQLQVESAEDVATSIRHALKYIAPKQLIVSSDCGSAAGVQSRHRFFQTVAIVQAQQRPPGTWAARNHQPRRQSDAPDRHRAQDA